MTDFRPDPNATAEYGSDNVTPATKQASAELHDVVPGENHDHTDAHPAVISATEASGGDPNGAGFSINWVSTTLIVVVMVVVFFVFLR